MSVLFVFSQSDRNEEEVKELLREDKAFSYCHQSSIEEGLREAEQVRGETEEWISPSITTTQD